MKQFLLQPLSTLAFYHDKHEPNGIRKPGEGQNGRTFLEVGFPLKNSWLREL